MEQHMDSVRLTEPCELPRGTNGHLVVPCGASGLSVNVYPFRVGTDEIYFTGPPVVVARDDLAELIAEG